MLREVSFFLCVFISCMLSINLNIIVEEYCIHLIGLQNATNVEIYKYWLLKKSVTQGIFCLSPTFSWCGDYLGCYGIWIHLSITNTLSASPLFRRKRQVLNSVKVKARIRKWFRSTLLGQTALQKIQLPGITLSCELGWWQQSQFTKNVKKILKNNVFFHNV